MNATQQINFPSPNQIKTRGRWVKFNNQWAVGLDEVFSDENIIIEDELKMDGSVEPVKNKYVIVESKGGSETIVQLAEFETTYKKYGICHVYTYTVSQEI